MAAVDQSKTVRKSKARHSLLVPTQAGTLALDHQSIPQPMELKASLSKSLKVNKARERKNILSERQLFVKVIQSLQKNRIEPQLINMMRYEL